MKKIEQFYDAGGIVFALRMLPNGSPEHGKDNPRNFTIGGPRVWEWDFVLAGARAHQ